MADDRRRPLEDLLRRARTARIRDEVVPGDELDPALIETIRRLHALDNAPPPDAAFVRRLREELLLTLAVPTRSGFASSHPVDGRLERRETLPCSIAVPPERNSARSTSSTDGRASLPLGSPSPAGKRAPSERRSWPLGQLAAALLICTIGVSYVAFLTKPLLGGQEFPAVLATPPVATPASNARPRPLLQVVLTEPITGGEATQLVRVSFAPGAYDREIARRDRPGPEVVYVESGTLMARLITGDRPPTILGAGSGETADKTNATANGAVEAGPGDTLLLPSGTTIELRNDTAAPTRVLWLVGNPATRGDQRGTSFELLGSQMSTVPPAAATLTLDRRTLAPNDQVVAPPPPLAIVVGLVDPPYGYLLADGRDGSARNISTSPRDVYVLTVAPGPAGAATTAP